MSAADRLAGALRTFCDLDLEMAEECAEALAESGVIDAIAAERAAEALERAAEIAHCGVDQRRLLHRATALRAERTDR